MKQISGRVTGLLIIVALIVTFFFLGRRYLWPPSNNLAIDTVGIIEAPEVNITSRIAGRIIKLDLIEGDRVTQGQVVCTIEDVDIRNQLAKARGDLANAQGDLNDANRTMVRYRRLYAEHVISAKDRDDATTHLDRARGAVDSAKASVEYYAAQLNDTIIRSPISGIIVSKNLEVGEWVTPGTSILTVDDLSTIWARVDVQETDLGSIRVGSPATVTMPGKPPQNYAGTVMAIGQEGQFATETDVRRGRQDIRTFYVKVRILQSSGDLKPGMTAEVSFPKVNQYAQTH
jgi:RND family efflux transporter MFP subunit